MMTGRTSAMAIMVGLVLLFAAGSATGITVAKNDSESYTDARENLSSVNDDIRDDLEENASGTQSGLFLATSGGLLAIIGPVAMAGFEFGYHYPGWAGFAVVSPYMLVLFFGYKVVNRVISR